MPTDLAMPQHIVMPHAPMVSDGGPLAYWDDWPTAVRVTVPQCVIQPLPDIRMGPICRVINPNTIDRITLFLATAVNVLAPLPDIETQIRVSPIAGGFANEHPSVTKGLAVIIADPLIQQVAGLRGVQFTLYARTTGENAVPVTMGFHMLGMTSGCCEKTLFA